MKISVVMASFLGDYPGCAKDRVKKFIRSVNSFLDKIVSWVKKATSMILK